MGGYLSLIGRGRGWGGRLLTFSAFRMGAYSRWVLIRGWTLIRVNTVSQTEINFWFSRSAKQCQNPCSGPPPVYQDLSTCHDWPVNKAIVNLPIRLKGNSKCISSSVSWVLWGPRTRAVDAGDYEDLTETGNCVRKVSGTQGKSLWKSDACFLASENFSRQKSNLYLICLLFYFRVLQQIS